MSIGVKWDPALRESILNDFFSGRKTAAELSEMTGVPVKTITQWAWMKRKECKEAGVEPPSRPPSFKAGAPKGNKNAVGSKGPAGKQNAKKHGAYASVIMGALDPDDQALIESLPDSIESHLVEEIKILTVREHRILKAIADYSDQELYLRSRTTKTRTRKGTVQTEDADQAEAVNLDEELDHGEKVVISTEWCCMELIIRLEHELTTIQIAIRENLMALGNIRRAAAEASAIRVRRKELELELLDARIEQVDAKTARLIRPMYLEDMSETDELLYGSGNETV